MGMQFDSTSAKHKLLIAVLLLAVFAVPFAWNWQNLSSADTKAVLAGGGVIGTAAMSGDTVEAAPTNHTGQVTISAGRSFTGLLAR
jgi:hypothetical protein